MSQFSFSIVCAVKGLTTSQYLDLFDYFSSLPSSVRNFILCDSTYDTHDLPDAVTSHQFFTSITHFYSSPNGIYSAWNEALPLINSDYVSFIGHDDRIPLSFFNAISSNLKLFERSLCPSLIYGNLVKIYPTFNRFIKSPSAPRLFSPLFPSCDIPIPGLFIKSSHISPFDTRFTYAADFLFLYLTSRLKSFSYLYVDSVQIYRVHDGITTSPSSSIQYLYDFYLFFRYYSILVSPFVIIRLIAAHLCYIFGLFFITRYFIRSLRAFVHGYCSYY